MKEISGFKGEVRLKCQAFLNHRAIRDFFICIELINFKLRDETKANAFPAAPIH